ncbi:MAG: CpsD/CapB family tyrosine-protein kinase [Oscillospiraceae bacterium]|nr:CpsD/CapB family tyrosine-protein kinase [Oscillospiraceae bacterium]
MADKKYLKEKNDVLLYDVLDDQARFDIVEAYKSVRTNIMFSLVGEETKLICFSSPEPSDGKTINCINLAITFAQTGAKVLIIDADLRKPRVHRCLKLQSEPGLTNVLGGFAALPDTLQSTFYDNLDVITCGHLPPNPAELLASDSMGELLEQLKPNYEYILIDCPPVNTVTDAAVLSSRVSGVVLVVRQGISTYDDVEAALEKLRFVDFKILGFLLNDVNEKAGSYGKKYYKRMNYESYAENRA